VHTERWPHAHGCTALSYVRQTQSHTGACDHKHAAIACHIRSRGKSVLSCQPVNKAKLIGRLGKQDEVMPLCGNLYSLTIVDNWLQRFANSIWHGKKCASPHKQCFCRWLNCKLSPMKRSSMSYLTEKCAVVTR